MAQTRGAVQEQAITHEFGMRPDDNTNLVHGGQSLKLFYKCTMGNYRSRAPVAHYGEHRTLQQDSVAI